MRLRRLLAVVVAACLGGMGLSVVAPKLGFRPMPAGASVLDPIITRVAGNNTYGYSGDGGSATSAEVRDATSPVFDRQGNMYFIDGTSAVVRKVALDGTITTVAGNGTAGYSGDGGPATSAELDGPASLAVDKWGNLYILDGVNETIRKVTPSGTISSLFQYWFSFCSWGYCRDGGLATDAAGNVYIADANDDVVWKMPPSNATLSIIAGNYSYGHSGDGGPASSARLAEPDSVAVDAAGNLFVMEQGDARVRRIDAATGDISTYAGNGLFTYGGYSGDGGPATAAELGSYTGTNLLAVDERDDLYIADIQNSVVRMVDPSGTISTVAGILDSTSPDSGNGGPATAADIFYPHSISVDALGNVYLSDYGGYSIREISVNPGPSVAETRVPNPSENGYCRICAGDPVDAGSGNYYASFTDLSIPGRSPALDETRTYGSLNAAYDGPFGYGWSSSYDMHLQLGSGSPPATVDVVQENDAQVPFVWDGSSYVAPSQVLATLVHNGNGTYTFTRRGQEQLIFDSTGLLIAEIALNGFAGSPSSGVAAAYTTTLAYSGGNLSTVTDGAGRTLTFSYGGNGKVSSIVDSTGRQVDYGYDGSDNLTDVTDVNGGNIHFTYSSHLLLTERDPRGHTILTNTYDGSARVLSQTDGLSQTTSFDYTSIPGATEITDPSSNVTVDTFVDNMLTSVTKGYGTAAAATTSYTYDPVTFGVATVVDPNLHQSIYTWDAAGNPLTKTDAVGRTTTTTYNSLNEPLTVTDPKGVTTTNTYDSGGNLTATSTPLVGSSPAQTQETDYTYGDSSYPGDVTVMTDPDGKTWDYTYDTYGNRTSSTDPVGNESTSTYNADGWKLTDVSAKGNVTGCSCAASYTTTYDYTIPGTANTDEFGDVQTVTDPLSNVTTYGYDADRNKTSVTDPNGNVTTYVYDDDNQLHETQRADTPQTTLTTDYNPDGTVADQKDGKGNALQTYGYDSVGRVTSVTDADSNITNYILDGNGNVLTKQDPGGNCAATPATGCTTYTYDADNELTGITYSDGTTPDVSSITYDADGQRTAMTDGTGTSTWTYDSLHRITGTTNGASKTVGYAYNLRNLPTTITYPGSHDVAYTYDDAGRMHTVTDWLSNTTTIGYDENSNIHTETFPSSPNLVDTFNYDHADQLSSIADVASGTSLFAATYTLDSNGQLATDSSVPSSAGSYQYSALNHLCYGGSTNTNACSSPPSGAIKYGTDAADNLTNNNGTTQQFDAADQLCWTYNGASSNSCASPPSTATTYSYDTRGNRTAVTPHTGTATSLTYNQANQLATISGPVSATYAYDANALRTTKTTGGNTTHYTWSTGNVPNILQETTGSNTTNYIYGPDNTPLEQITPANAVLYYSHDQQGSTRLITDTSASPQNTYTYDPYGNITASSVTVTNPLQYDGQYTDAETGYTYLRNRYYDHTTAQFLTQDPAIATTMSPYAYVADNPLNEIDPMGLCGGWGWATGDCEVRAAASGAEHHWRGIAQVAIAATAVTVAVVSVGSLSGVSAVLAGAAIGAVSSGVSYDVGCVGTSGGCTATGSITAILVGGVSGGAAAGVGGLVCGDSSLCLSAVGLGIGAGTATAGYYAANELEGTCSSGNGALSAAESGLGGVSASQSDWNTVWGDLKKALAGGSGGDE